MFIKEIKKNTQPYFFIVSVVIVLIFVYLNIQPGCRYYYGQPLSKAEFIYNGLKDDYNSHTLKVYEGEELSDNTVYLSEHQLKIIQDVLIKINPEFEKDKNKKLSEISITCSDSECIALSKELENKLNYKTDYYYMLDYYSYDTYMSGRFHNSREEYNLAIYKEKNDFNNILKTGLTAAYARYAVDSLGMIIGVLSIFFSVFLFQKDRKNKTSELIFTSARSSLEVVGYRALSAIIPLLSIAVVSGIFICCFFLKENIYYGYTLNYWTIFEYVFAWVLPTILITVMISIFLDLLLENSMLVFLIQFVIWYLSVSNILGDYNLFQTVIRFSTFGCLDVYEKYRVIIRYNRILMCLLSLGLFAGSVLIFELKRQDIVNLRNVVSHIKRKSKTNIEVTTKIKVKHSLIFYGLKNVVSANVLLAVIFMILILPVVYRKSMNSDDLAVLGENIIVFVSAFVLIPLCNIESRNQVQEYIILCRTSYVYVFFQRIIIGITIIFLLISIPLKILALISGVKLGFEILGVFASSLFLGLLGVLFSELTQKNVVGYFVYIGYYFWCTFLKHNYKMFNVCGYTYKISNSKYSIIVGISIICMLLFIIEELRQKGKL